MDPDPESPVSAAWLVLTDLDGTLLDHHDYSTGPARPALRRLAALGVPVILASSKTRAELAAISAKLQLNAPIIAENGALVAIPPGWPGDAHDDPPGPPGPPSPSDTLQHRSLPYPELHALLDRLRRDQRLKFTGFGDLDAAGIAALTGLALSQARLAGRREASEPILWQDSDAALQDFGHQLADHGLRLLRGGRFLHVLGHHADKALAATDLISGLRGLGWRGRSIALGDAPNDHGLLSLADYPVVVRNPASPAMPAIDNPRLLHTRLPGPAGWREAIDHILNGVTPNHTTFHPHHPGSSPHPAPKGNQS
jgi:mannosyl-3-phosphoglycerate phosphatase